MVNVKEAIKHYNNLYNSKAVYLWGANCEVIDSDLCNKLYKRYGNKTYNKKYYDDKLKEGHGRIGADCSGSVYPLSGYDNTAQGYFNGCVIKGSIKCINKDKACLVFKGSSMSKINHIGFYCGDGYVIEMKSSKLNCVKSKLESGKWNYYGIPAFIDYNIELMPTLSYGDNNQYVLHWQKYLAMAGFYKDAIDGIFGHNTQDAVMAFQRMNHLKEDGIIGQECWNFLGIF